MEKNRILGASTLSFLMAGLFLSLCSCSLPRILVLNDPLTPQEHINLGVSYERSGKLDEALKEYEKASRTLPVAYLYMGNILFQKKEFPTAEECYREAIDRTGDPGAYNNLAWLHYTTNSNLDEAEKLARKAVELAPDKEEFNDTLKKIQEKKNEKTPQQDLSETASQVITMKPDNIFARIPTDIPEEIFETIAARGAVKIERIVSCGQTTPEGSWYDQELNEWVILLKGSADILFDREPKPITLIPGDHLLIPAHRRHRVTRTDEKGPTVWVAVHFA